MLKTLGQNTPAASVQTGGYRRVFSSKTLSDPDPKCNNEELKKILQDVGLFLITIRIHYWFI